MARTTGLLGQLVEGHEEPMGPDRLGVRFGECVAAGDLDGIVQLYAADAVVSLRDGREAAGHQRIREAFAAALAAGCDLALEPAGPAMVTGTIACTTSRGADGRLCTQVARQEPDGTWRWVRDGFRLRDFACPGEGEGLGGGDDEDQAGLADVA